MREKIIALFRDSFIDDCRIFAMWLEGSDGLGCADEFSDIDIWLDAAEGSEKALLDECQRLLETFGELDMIDRINHPHPQIFQRNMHIAGTSEHLTIDICIQSHSRDRAATVFIENDIAELPLVLFDKANVIRLAPEPAPDIAAIVSVLNKTATKFAQRGRVTKYLHRGNYLESLAMFDSYVRRPIVTLLRLLHTPRHVGYGLMHISRHLPADDLSAIEKLYEVSAIGDIEGLLPFADRLFSDIRARINHKYGLKNNP